MQRSLSDALDRACSVRPYFYLRLFMRVHFTSSRAPIVKAPLKAHVTAQYGLVEQLKSIFKQNRADCDTSTKFGTVILMGILNKSARLAT